MRDFRDAKAMAHTLREALKAKSVSLTHSESLELVAKTLGFPDWNFLAAKIQYSQPASAPSDEAVSHPRLTAMFAGAVLPILAVPDLRLLSPNISPHSFCRANAES